MNELTRAFLRDSPSLFDPLRIERMPDPGSVIAVWLGEQGMTQQELADRMDASRVKINKLVNNRRTVTVDTARRLEAVTGVPGLVWLVLQAARDLRNTP